MGARRRKKKAGVASCACILIIIGIIVIAAAPSYSDYNEWEASTKDECKFLQFDTTPCNKCSGTQGRTTCTSINKTVGLYQVKGNTCSNQNNTAKFYDECSATYSNYPTDPIWTDTQYNPCWIKSCNADNDDLTGNPGCKGDCTTYGWTFDIETY